MSLLKELSNATEASGSWTIRSPTNDYSLGATLIYSIKLTNNSQINEALTDFSELKSQIISQVPSGYSTFINVTSMQITSK